MTKSELKRKRVQSPERYRVCQMPEGIQEKQYVTVDGDGDNGNKIGIVVMLDYPKPGQCVIDLDIDQRINEGKIGMENSWLVFLASLLSKVGEVRFKPIIVADDKLKKEIIKIDLTDYDMTFIGEDIGDAVKKTAQFFDNLPQISERFLKEGELRTSAKKILLGAAKNVE